MQKLICMLALLLLTITITGCASMSKQDCETADWHTIGYNDGARGDFYSNLDNYRKRCAGFQITPDTNAYQNGWNQGIRSYCTGEIGYRIGMAGQAYQNICPADLAPGYMAGWQQGIQQYCTPDNGFRQGLAGYPYRGVCPAYIADGFQNRYRLGQDLRQSRNSHNETEYKLDKVRKNLSTEKDEHRYHDLLEELARLRHEEENSESEVGALEACANDDWFQVGISDGESGNPYRAHQIAELCRGYGGGEDEMGYRDGWSRGNSHYCSFDSGLYAGQNNQEYRGVCSGSAYQVFWGGYLKGIQLFKAGRYEDHPRPQFPHEERNPREERHSGDDRSRSATQPSHDRPNVAQPPGVHANMPEQIQQFLPGKAGDNKPADQPNTEHPGQQAAPDRHGGKADSKETTGKTGDRKPVEQKKTNTAGRNHVAKPIRNGNSKSRKPADKSDSSKQAKKQKDDQPEQKQADKQGSDKPDQKHDNNSDQRNNSE